MNGLNRHSASALQTECNGSRTSFPPGVATTGVPPNVIELHPVSTFTSHLPASPGRLSQIQVGYSIRNAGNVRCQIVRLTSRVGRVWLSRTDTVLEFSLDLKDSLAKMGMPDAFGPKSDFCGMDGTQFLYVSGVFHKTWGEV